jgi:hypothetical protein
MKWKQVDFPVLDQVAGSGQSYLLPSTSWPKWAAGGTQFRRILIYCPDPANPLASTATTARIIGRLLTERFDPKDLPRPFNYDFYLLAESTSGRAFQSGPIAASEPAHHSSAPSTWLDGYGPPSV